MQSYCLFIRGREESVTGTVVLMDTYVPYGYGFENLALGPGSIQLSMQVSWYLPATEFLSFRAVFFDTTTIPITWVAS